MSEANQIVSQVQLLNVKQVAQMLGCSVRSIWRMRDWGRMPPPIKVGRRLVRWDRAIIETWARAGCPKMSPRPAQPGPTGVSSLQVPAIPVRR